MKIGRSVGPAPTSGGPSRPQPAAGFSPSAGVGAAASPARNGSATSLAGLDTLLTLQAQGGPLDRRRRQLARAGRVLDRLDDVRLALLAGVTAGPALDGLGHALAEAREAVDDPALGELLDAVETRAAVELAKRERARAG